LLPEVKTELKLCNEAKDESEMTMLTSKLSCDDCRTILRGQETDQWLSLLPWTVNAMELSAEEFSDALFCGMQGVLRTCHHFAMVATKSSVSIMRSSAKRAVLSSHVTYLTQKLK
jgi:hypothetical protein